jgi:hypothetical protein
MRLLDFQETERGFTDKNSVNGNIGRNTKLLDDK